VAFLAFFLFQFAFADTASTITSGAMVGRTGFKGDILYSACVSGFIYPIFGHWVWGPGGWLANTMGWFNGFTHGVVFRDFAGSTVVHTVGGFIALAGCIALGPRLGRKFKRDGGGPTPPHDLTIGALGGVILWFGWYGFNPAPRCPPWPAADPERRPRAPRRTRGLGSPFLTGRVRDTSVPDPSPAPQLDSDPLRRGDAMPHLVLRSSSRSSSTE
jgi:hypothetical protein